MKRFVPFAMLLLIVTLFSGCAASYHTIFPNAIRFPSMVTEDGVQLSYQYDILRSSGNNRYGAKEEKKGLRLIALKIKNLADTSICLSRDYDLFSGDIKIIPLESSAISGRLKQKVWPYYFYMLMTLVRIDYMVTTPTTITTGTIPVGWALGPGLTLLNTMKASSSNRKLYYNLNQTAIWNRVIKTGETAYGLIGIEGPEVRPIHLRKK
jgi:hypothetical protein